MVAEGSSGLPIVATFNQILCYVVEAMMDLPPNPPGRLTLRRYAIVIREEDWLEPELEFPDRWCVSSHPTLLRVIFLESYYCICKHEMETRLY
jgi:hypothetical protein